LILIQGLVFGSFNGLVANIGFYTEPYGIDEISLILIFVFFSGITGSLFGSIILKFHKKYKLLMVIYIFSLAIGFVFV